MDYILYTNNVYQRYQSHLLSLKYFSALVAKQNTRLDKNLKLHIATYPLMAIQHTEMTIFGT